MIPVTRAPTVIKFIQTESRRWVPVAGGGARGVVFHGDGVLIWEDEKFLEMTVVIAAQQCERTGCHRITGPKGQNKQHTLCYVYFTTFLKEQ